MSHVKNTSALVIGTPPSQQHLSRRFLGNLFPKTTIEKNELKAYIDGKEYYHYGKDDMGNPIRHKVRQEYYYK